MSLPKRGAARHLFVLFQLAILLTVTVFVAVHVPGVGNISQAGRLFGVWFGLTFSLVSLIAAWTALGRGSTALRLTLAMVAVLAVWVIAFGVHFQRLQGPRIVMPGVAMILQFGLVQIPIWFARWMQGLRLTSSETSAPSMANTPEPLQFGIKHLFGWMTFIAILSAIVRGIGGHAMGLPELLPFTVFLIFNSMLAWPWVAAGFASRARWVVVLFGAIVTVTLCLVEPWVFRAAGVTSGSPQLFFWVVNVVQSVWILGSTWTLYGLGWRLERGLGTSARARELA